MDNKRTKFSDEEWDFLEGGVKEYTGEIFPQKRSIWKVDSQESQTFNPTFNPNALSFIPSPPKEQTPQEQTQQEWNWSLETGHINDSPSLPDREGVFVKL